MAEPLAFSCAGMKGSELQPDNRLSRRKRLKVLVLHELGVLVYDRVQHPRAARAHT